MGIFDFLKSKETRIEEEWIYFNSLEKESKISYLNNNQNSLIYWEAKKKMEIVEIKDEILIYESLIKIDDELNGKNESFFSEISILNMDEKFNVLSNITFPKQLIKIYLEKKVKFFTYYKIFENDLYNISLDPFNDNIDRRGPSYDTYFSRYNRYPMKQYAWVRTKLVHEKNSSLNKNFNLYLNGLLLNLNSLLGPKKDLNNQTKITRSKSIIHLHTQIEDHIIKNYQKIFGQIEKIEKLNKLYKGIRLDKSPTLEDVNQILENSFE